MDTPHEKIIEETEYRMLYDEEFILLYDKEFILLSDSRLIAGTFFTYFQTLLQFGIIFWGTTITLHKTVITQKRIIRVMLGLRHLVERNLRNYTY
jgi:hypothetical protein